MVRTVLPIITPKGPFPGVVAPDDLDFVFTASDLANKNDFLFTGRELILVQNTDVGAQTITLTSALDPQKRTQDITAYSFAADEFGIFWAGDLVGWIQTGGKFHLEASAVTVLFAIIRIPN